MNIPDNMTLKATVESKGDSGPGKSDPKTMSLSERFSWPGRIAILLAIVLSPWAFASVPYWSQRWIMLLLLGALGFWWFETALNQKKSQVFPYMFYLVALGLVIGVFQLLPLPEFLTNLFTGRQAELYKEYSGNPDASVSISLDREGTWHQLRLLVMGISGLLLGCRFFREKSNVILLMSVVTISGVALTLFGIVQKFSSPSMIYWTYQMKQGEPHFGPFVNRNNAAGYFCMCLACCICLLLIVMQPNKKKDGEGLADGMQILQKIKFQLLEFVAGLTATKIALLMASVILIIGVIATASRGGVVAMVGASVGTLLLYGVARKPKNTVFFLVPVLGTVVLAVSWFGFGDRLLKRFERIDMVNGMSTNVRIVHWKDTYPAVGDMGVIGSGLGSYRRVHRLYRSDHESGIFEYAENQFFQALVEAGWPGLIIFLVAWCLAFQYAYLLLFKGSSAFSIGAGTCGMFVLFSQAISSCFDFGFYIPANLLLVSALIGFLAYQSQSLAGRLKDRTWLRFATPNYLVQAIVLALFAFSTLSALSLHRLAGIDQLLYPKSAKITRDNMPAEETEERIALLSSRLKSIQYSKGLNYLGELYIHRARLGIFESILQVVEENNAPTFDKPWMNEEENDKAQKDKYWELTDTQRIQENIYYQKTNNGFYAARDYLTGPQARGDGPKPFGIQEGLYPSLESFTRSAQVSPIQPVVHLRIGQISGALGALEVSGAGDLDIEHALELAPSNANFRKVAGVHYLQSGKARESIPHLRKYLELMPEEATSLFNLVSGRESRQIAFLSEGDIGLEIIPDNPAMLFQYADSYVSSESPFLPKILERASKVLADQPNMRREYMILSGDIKRAQGDLELALEEYQRALTSLPNDPETRYKMGLVFEDLGQIDAALEQALELNKAIEPKPEYNKFLKRLNSIEKKN